MFFNNSISILQIINVFINTYLLITTLTFFFSKDFKLSKIRLSKYIQIFTFVCISIYLIYNILNILNISLSDIIPYMADNKDVNLHGHVSVYKEADKAIDQGLQRIGNHIGFSITIAGVAAVVVKTLIKNLLPQVQKAGAVVGAGLLGGLIHSSISQYNISKISSVNIDNITSVNNVNDSNINNFINDNVSSSPLEVISSNLESTNYICIYMLIILIIQILFKFYFKENKKLKFSLILGPKINNILELIINKIIIVNKKMSIYYILLILISILISLCSSIFFITDISNNLDDYIKNYNSIKGK